VLYSEESDSKKLCDILESLLVYTKLKNIEITNIVMSERGSWHLELANGAKVFLGKQEIVNKMRKFVSFYSNLNEDASYFDLRYHNGIAVGKKLINNIAQGEGVRDGKKNG
jgi:cell division protein FtsQ